MSLTLFTVIEAKDHQLRRALDHLKRTTRSPSDVMFSPRPSAPAVPAASAPASAFVSESADPVTAPAATTTNASSAEQHNTADLYNDRGDDVANNIQYNTTLPYRRPRSEQYLLPVYQPRPQTPRRSTEPHPSALSASQYSESVTYRPRNRSPYSRSTPRSRSTTAPASMHRAQSLPARSNSPYSPTMSSGSCSPLPRSPKRSGSPFGRPSSRDGTEPYTMSPSFYDGGFETISEHSELEISRSTEHGLVAPSLYGSLNSSRSLSAQRRQRPTSPVPNTFSSAASSPALSSSSGRFISDGYPTLHHFGSYSSISSMPSTPSSNRSRSPSISSLETIEDAPDLEWQAIEADRIAKLKAAADAEDADHEPRRRSSLDIPGSRPGAGFGFGRNNQRKRWSVCGAERRADLDLETIWED